MQLDLHRVDGELLLLHSEYNQDHVSQFGVSTVVEVDPTEGQGANALLVESRLIYPAEFPLTRRRLEEAGLNILTVPASELAKAEGAVTCCSVVFS
ncbi:MAG: hypothetical protein ABFS37_01340 [Acidobacteriota bacterium]